LKLTFKLSQLSQSPWVSIQLAACLRCADFTPILAQMAGRELTAGVGSDQR